MVSIPWFSFKCLLRPNPKVIVFLQNRQVYQTWNCSDFKCPYFKFWLHSFSAGQEATHTSSKGFNSLYFPSFCHLLVHKLFQGIISNCFFLHNSSPSHMQTISNGRGHLMLKSERCYFNTSIYLSIWFPEFMLQHHCCSSLLADIFAYYIWRK